MNSKLREDPLYNSTLYLGFEEQPSAGFYNRQEEDVALENFRLLRPYHPYTCFITRPYFSKGVTPGGIYLEHDERLPGVFAYVMDCHPTVTEVKVGDLVIFRQHSWEEALTSLGQLYVIHEKNLRAIIQETPNCDW